MLAPVLEQVASQFEGKCKFVNVDVDESSDLAKDLALWPFLQLSLLKMANK